MNKTLKHFQPYFISGFIYLCVNLLLRFTDFLLLAPMFNIPSDPVIFLKCLLNDLIWCGSVFTLLLPLYFLISLKFKRTALFICSILFGILFLIQIVLVLFAFYGGKLLDKEIFTRPVYEIYTTVKSYGSIILFISSGILVILIFPVTAIYFGRRAGKRSIAVFNATAAILILSILLISYPRKLYAWNTEGNRFLINRALYFAFENYNYFRKDPANQDSDVRRFSHLASEFPDWVVPDTLFPFRHIDNTPDVLSPFFTLGKEKPDIVYIIIESLGRGVSGENAFSGSFTPFLDSLSNHCLYWGNCLSTAQRSFGILPSLLGSLPNGNTGFQFGGMPNHTTIIRLLKDNGYKTSMFYAGYYEFDNVLNFMKLQGNDYFAPFYEEFKASDFEEEEANEWGYSDKLLFDKSIDYISERENGNNFDLYVTLTTHNNLDIPGKEKYIAAAKALNKTLSVRQQKRNNNHIEHLASFLYVDDALRHFLKGYMKLPSYNNTIFVITGDHFVSNFGIANRLSLYNVPLYIFSPALKTSRKFGSLVSVLDITPSVWSMLFSNYQMRRPEYVSWISDGLDTAQSFSSRKKILLMQDNRDRKEFIYNNFFFSYDSIYEIHDNLKLKPASQSEYGIIQDKYRLFKSVEKYVYNNNMLMPGEVAK